MFGPQRDFENRIAEYRSNLVGIKHLHRLKLPLENLLRPQPNQPINLHVTTSGGVAYDSVRCWTEVDGEESTFELVSDSSVWNALEWRYVRHWHGEIPPQPSGAVIHYRIGDASWGQIDGFLQITKRECYPKQPNSLSLLTITTYRSGSAMPLSITSSSIDSIRGTVYHGKNRQTSLGFSVEHFVA